MQQLGLTIADSSRAGQTGRTSVWSTGKLHDNVGERSQTHLHGIIAIWGMCGKKNKNIQVIKLCDICSRSSLLTKFIHWLKYKVIYQRNHKRRLQNVEKYFWGGSLFLPSNPHQEYLTHRECCIYSVKVRLLEKSEQMCFGLWWAICIWCQRLQMKISLHV